MFSKEHTGLTKLDFGLTGQDIEISVSDSGVDTHSWKTASEAAWDTGLRVAPLDRKGFLNGEVEFLRLSVEA